MKTLVGLLNPQQWKLLGAFLFAGTGPVAWLLSKKFGMADADVKMWLEFAAVITSTIGGGLILNSSTNAAQAQAVATMPVEEKAKALATVSDAGQASIAASLPDKAVVIAAGTVPGVQVHALPGVAPPSVIAAAIDPANPDVVVMTGGPVDYKP